MSDILYLLYYVKYGIESLMNMYVPRECIPPKSFLNAIVYWIVLILRDTFRRVSAWLGVFLAAIRYLVTKYPMNHTIQVLMKTGTSWKVFAWMSMLSLLVTGINNGWFMIAESRRWTPDEKCTMYSPNSTFPNFEVVRNLLFDDYQSQISATYLFIDAILQLIPSVLYPFLAAALLIQLRIVKNSRRIMMKKEENGDTAYVILCMTITYFLAGTPYACAEFHYASVPIEELSLQFIVNNLTVIFTTFLFINSSIHILFCFFLSSQYRTTFISVFRCRTKQRNTSVASVRGINSNGT